ncbi:response regulator transcription factor [Actinomadura harenae]|uniref:DNA-binding response regulator n=1 Tax=Actinomadura harenae TaxID=2483351 RepID=A0A3M2MIP5_9ACTN|nr:response regulator transcription factor [Actinomadura harenae]RMI47218.1 DNA-binding response regulator [Actinomadura harenae]
MWTAARILLAEDDPKQARLIRVYLEREGHRVTAVGDGRQALEQARALRPDLLILDVMMPGVDGLDVCRILRAESSVPILLLTARSTEEDQLLGLDLGADDYLTKPFSPRVLTARVRALLRRAGAGKGPVASGEVLRAGDLEIDPDRFEVRVAGRKVELTAKEFGILQILAAEPHRVFTRAHILELAFGFDHHVLERTVDAHVMNLRRKIEPDPADPVYVQTVYGRGYRLGPVADHPAANATGPGAGATGAAG